MGVDRRPRTCRLPRAEHAVGWLVFWNTAEYARSRDLNDNLVGSGPYLVDRQDGSIHHIPATTWVAEDWEDLYLRQIKGIRQPDPLASSVGALVESTGVVAAMRHLRKHAPRLRPQEARAYVTAVRDGAEPSDELASLTQSVEPREGALHSPPLGLDLEAALVGVLADDLQVAAEDLSSPLDQAAGEAAELNLSAESAARARLLDSRTTYTPDGLDITEPLGPLYRASLSEPVTGQTNPVQVTVEGESPPQLGSTATLAVQQGDTSLVGAGGWSGGSPIMLLGTFTTAAAGPPRDSRSGRCSTPRPAFRSYWKSTTESLAVRVRATWPTRRR
ncbi:hypothetical protein GCM10010495_77630 [Kitasatospora herbaricolor]|uniref:YrhB domain-containing protein n=1 Tax=Kitasatospora herbaricolor TaxID=68217 RepID=UPI0019B419C9|nr:YrhB domain-containing protein [Kitasatospora herbaricolor]MDQ0305551.1 hypothetical protein [Kitasatospora herbaricolor]GGV48302.1 hypothetical protein GCM10010495_77630 [Kitasatospora herbaricolor]